MEQWLLKVVANIGLYFAGQIENKKKGFLHD